MRNLFCDHSDLRNEADVEQNFARRLIEALGYSDKAIRPKAALEELTVGNVGETERHRPDFAMKVSGHIRWILEAKAPKERLENHFRQPHDYAAAINAAYATTDPVRFFLLTNGLETILYEVGKQRPILTLGFQQFAEGNPDYRKLTEALRPAAFGSPPPDISRHHPPVETDDCRSHFRLCPMSSANPPVRQDQPGQGL